MSRQEYNRKILEKLSEIVEKYPNWRFQQLLWNVGIITRDMNGHIEDNFYEESSDTCYMVNEYIEQLLERKTDE